MLSKNFAGAISSTVTGLEPNVLIVTTSCASSGIDSPLVATMYHEGLLPSFFDMAQAHRCTGRSGDDCVGDIFFAMFHLGDFLYHLERIYSDN